MSDDRVVWVSPERLAGWVERFGERHGGFEVRAADDAVALHAADGAVAILVVPFPPAPSGDDVLASTLDHAQCERRVGVVLVRRGGYAVGVFDGVALVVSKVGSSYVQGTTKAGGWSQQRYARRRANQTAHAYATVVDVAADLLLPRITGLDAVVGGGDRPGVEAVLGDPRLRLVQERWTGDVWPTPDPRLRVLQAFPDQFRAVTIRLNSLA